MKQLLFFSALVIGSCFSFGQTIKLEIDINTGTNSSYPKKLISYGNNLFFRSDDGINGEELWKYDGNTHTLFDINPGSGGSYPDNFIVFNNNLYFTANDGTNGLELWKYDGTSLSLIQIRPGSNGSNPKDFCIFNGELFFNADDGTNGAELWKYDGISASIASIIRPGSSGTLTSYPTVYNGNLYFSANNGTSGVELWQYNGVSASLVADIYSGTGSSTPQDLIVYNNELYFYANDGINGGELWKYNGTSASLVADIYSGGSSIPSRFIVFNNELIFMANDGINGYELWKHDGTTTSLLFDINPGSAHSLTDWLTILNGELLFRANDGVNGVELWKYDGSSTIIVSDINSGSSGSSPDNLYIYNNELYFRANNGINGTEIWKYNGVNTSLLHDINPGLLGSEPNSFLEWNSKLFFQARDIDNGYELWSYSPYTDSTITTTVCDSLISPSGDSVWFANGTYYDTVNDTAYTINLTINQLDIALYVDSNTRCYGDSNGGATVTILPPYNGPYSFIWSTGDTLPYSSIVNQPAGELSVKVIDANGCYKSDTVTITQPDSLTVSITLDSNVSCNGTTDGGATALHHGGNYPYNYSWSNGGNSPTITNVSTGTYTVTVTDYWGCTPAVDSITIIKLNPSSVTIYETVCDSLVSPSGNFTWTATGIYKDTIPNSVGCDSVMTFDLTVNHPSTSTDSKTICQGDSTIIGGKWYYNDTIVNDTLTNSKLCDSVVTITVTKVSPSPINLGADTSICHNDSITISAGVYDSYLWINGDTTASIVVKGSIVGVGSNNYWIEATDTNGCISKDTITVTITQCSNAGINEALIHNLIAIYPNPITEQSFTINFNSYEEDCIIEILDVSGKIIKRINRQNKSIINVNLTTEKGIYFVKFISQNNEIGVAKIVKQ